MDRVGYSFGIVLLGIFCCVADAKYVGTCTSTEVENCLSPFQKYAKDVHFFPDQDLATRLHMCRDWKSTKHCLDGYVPFCDHETLLLLKGLTDMYKSVCQNESLQTYGRIYRCMGKPEVETEGATCKTKLAYGDRTMCGREQDYIDCIYQVLDAHCGQEAAEWEVNLVLTLIRPRLEGKGCFLQPPRPQARHQENTLEG